MVTEKGMNQSFNVLKNIILSFESGAIPENKNFCEPFLSKYNLYPTISFYNPEKNKSSKKKLQTLRDLMAYSDGKNNIFEIALKINKSLAEVLEAYKILKQKKIIRGKFI